MSCSDENNHSHSRCCFVPPPFPLFEMGEAGGGQKCYTQPMSALSSDTHPKMEALQIQLWRQASPTRKMHMLAQLNASARLLALTGLRSRYPNASNTELRRKLADLILGTDLARKVYGEISHAK